jgi:hypothetical protein
LLFLIFIKAIGFLEPIKRFKKSSIFYKTEQSHI